MRDIQDDISKDIAREFDNLPEYENIYDSD